MTEWRRELNPQPAGYKRRDQRPRPLGHPAPEDRLRSIIVGLGDWLRVLSGQQRALRTEEDLRQADGGINLTERA